jgi:hypothetical protein
VHSRSFSFVSAGWIPLLRQCNCTLIVNLPNVQTTTPWVLTESKYLTCQPINSNVKRAIGKDILAQDMGGYTGPRINSRYASFYVTNPICKKVLKSNKPKFSSSSFYTGRVYSSNNFESASLSKHFNFLTNGHLKSASE